MSRIDYASFDEAHAWLGTVPWEKRTVMAVRACLRSFQIAGRASSDDFEPLVLGPLKRLLWSTIRTNTLVKSGMYQRWEPFEDQELSRLCSEAAKRNTDAIYDAVAAAHDVQGAFDKDRLEFRAGIPPSQVGGVYDAMRSSLQSLFETRQLATDDFSMMVSEARLETDELWHQPLWSEQDNPNSNDLDLLREKFKEHPKWEFWFKWYEQMWVGNFEDWDLAFQVTQIDGAIWNEGAEAVATEIQKLTATNLEAKLPQTTRIEFDAQQAKFTAIPQEIAKPDLLGATLNQIEDALEDVLANPSNGLNHQSRESRVLNRTFKKYGNDPQQIEMGLVSTHASLTRQMLSEELPESEENLALQSALEEGALGIRATHPEIAENRAILSTQRFAELSESDREVLRDALPIVQAVSDSEMSADWEHDIPALANTSAGPLPSGAPVLPGADEATRIFSRSAKMSLLIRTTNIVRAIDDSAPYKAIRIGAVLDALVRMGLRLLTLF